jgi:hypothetical protein
LPGLDGKQLPAVDFEYSFPEEYFQQNSILVPFTWFLKGLKTTVTLSSCFPVNIANCPEITSPRIPKILIESDLA